MTKEILTPERKSARGRLVGILLVGPLALVGAISLAADEQSSGLTSITGSSSIGHSITGSSSIGHSITGSSSIGHSITGSSSIGHSITGSSSIGHSITGSSSISQSISGSSRALTSIYVVGLVASADEVSGTITVGDVLVYAGSADIFGLPSVGSIALVSGIYPDVGDLVIADSITTLTPSDESSQNLMSISGSSKALK